MDGYIVEIIMLCLYTLYGATNDTNFMFFFMAAEVCSITISFKMIIL